MSSANKLPGRAHVAGGLLVMFAITGFTEVRTQLLDRNFTLERAKDSQLMTTRPISAVRGLVVTRSGVVLAQTVETYDIYLQAGSMPRIPSAIAELASTIGVPSTKITEALDLYDAELATLPEKAEKLTPEEKKQRLAVLKHSRTLLAANLSVEQKNRVRAIAKRWDAGGISIESHPQRIYPTGERCASWLGGMDGLTAAGGLETLFDSQLKGENGSIRGWSDSMGNLLPEDEANEQDKRDGQTLTLTIDADLQEAAARAIRQATADNKAHSGVVVILDPSNGDILSLADWPSPDPYKPMVDFRCRGYSRWYEPGSTFKILTLAEALQKNQASLDEIIDCPGTIHFGRKNRYHVSCDKRHGPHGHGALDAQSAIARSCNVIASTWSRRVGYEGMLDYVKRLGLLDRTGVFGAQESRGKFNQKDPAKEQEIANLGFGQSIGCTPLGLASAFSMIGNDGVRMRPRLVKQLDGVEQPVRSAGQMVDAQVANQVKTIMESVIDTSEGTGHALRIAGYRLAGKTGTAEKRGKGIEGKHYVSSFVGFVPADKPKALILVMVDDPDTKIAYYGASVAGPVFKTLAQKVIDIYHVPKDVTADAESPG